MDLDYTENGRFVGGKGAKWAGIKRRGMTAADGRMQMHPIGNYSGTANETG